MKITLINKRTLGAAFIWGICLLGTGAPAIAQDSTLKEHPEREDVTGVDSADAEMQAAQQKAQDTLMTFIEAVQKREEKKRYLLKVRLAEGDDVEHVWLEPVEFREPGLIGILAVEPVAIEAYVRGDVVKPLPKDITDWVILNEDGTKEGGYTMDVMAKKRK